MTVRLKENRYSSPKQQAEDNGLKLLVGLFTLELRVLSCSRENERVEILINRIRDKDIRDPLDGEFNTTFY